MELIPLEIRRTHRYRDGWSHLDAWEHFGSAKITPPRPVDPRPQDRDDYSVGPVQVYTARIPAGQDRELSIKALRDYFESSPCRCEHDCCGCPSTHATVRPVHGYRRAFSIRVATTYNY